MFVNTQELADIGRHAGGPRFWDPENDCPCQQPPWGLLTAVDSKTGDIACKVPLGSYPELERPGFNHAGTPNIGGVTATASGLLFVSGTLDNRMYAFESKTGKELWSTDLGAAGHAIPVTYLGKDRKQYVAAMVSGGDISTMQLSPHAAGLRVAVAVTSLDAARYFLFLPVRKENPLLFYARLIFAS